MKNSNPNIVVTKRGACSICSACAVCAPCAICGPSPAAGALIIGTSGVAGVGAIND